MKRGFGGLMLAVLVAVLTYGYVVTQRERSYWDVVMGGDAALARDDSYAAIEAFSVAISLKADSMAAHLKRGEAYRRRGEYDSALRDLRRAAEIDPLSPYPLELLGDVHYALAARERDFTAARFNLALDNYRAALALDDGAGRVQYKVGLAAYRSGQLPLATAALEQATQLDSRIAEAHYLLGVCLRAAHRPRDAVASLERAVSLSPAFVAAREELSETYASLGRHDDRMQQLEALRGLQPTPARERALGLAYASAGQMNRAVAQLRRATQRYPDDAQTHVALGRLWLDRAGAGGDFEVNRALEALASAVRTVSSSEALTLYGRALLLDGQVGRAERALQEAVATYPIQPQAFLYLSEASSRRGRAASAQAALIDYATLVRAETLPPSLLIRLAQAHIERGHLLEASRVVEVVLDKNRDHPVALALQKQLQ